MKPENILPIVRWIASEGLRGAHETALLPGLCAQLDAAGVPLMRVNVSQPTLHPIIGGHMFIWRRGATTADQEDWDRNMAAARLAQVTAPFDHMMMRGETRLRRRLTTGEGIAEFPMLERFRAEGATDYFAFRVDFGEAQRLGPADGIYVSWLSDAPGGFEPAHLAAIEQFAEPLGLALKNASTYRIANSVIETYLGRDAGQRVLGGTIERGSGETIRAALWYSDLQGFTKLADTLPRDELLALLHDYFACIVETVHEQQGQVLKFIGDGVLAIFNLADDSESCLAALEAGDRVMERTAALTAQRRADGRPVTQVYLGLHLGGVMYGNIGAGERLDFTVLGPTVNEVSRIEAMCRALDQTLIASAAFARAAGDCRGRLVSLGRYVLRGVRRPQELFTLVRAEDAAAGGEA
jgi:adenylate cyclase